MWHLIVVIDYEWWGPSDLVLGVYINSSGLGVSSLSFSLLKCCHVHSSSKCPLNFWLWWSSWFSDSSYLILFRYISSLIYLFYNFSKLMWSIIPFGQSSPFKIWDIAWIGLICPLKKCFVKRLSSNSPFAPMWLEHLESFCLYLIFFRLASCS